MIGDLESGGEPVGGAGNVLSLMAETLLHFGLPGTAFNLAPEIGLNHLE